MKEGPMKPPVSHDKIYKIMLGVTFGVTIGFFLINVIRGNVLAMTVIGICLFVLTSAQPCEENLHCLSVFVFW